MPGNSYANDKKCYHKYQPESHEEKALTFERVLSREGVRVVGLDSQVAQNLACALVALGKVSIHASFNNGGEAPRD